MGSENAEAVAGGGQQHLSQLSPETPIQCPLIRVEGGGLRV